MKIDLNNIAATAAKYAHLSTGENQKTANSFGVQLEDADKAIWASVRTVCAIDGVEAKPLAWYREVADWLTDTQGRWLMITGACGTGKSFITMVVLQSIFDAMGLENDVVVVNRRTINDTYKVALDQTKKIILLDDIGRETHHFVNGREVNPVAEIINYAYSHKQLVIMSTNLGSKELRDMYGDPTVDRLMHRSLVINIKDSRSLRHGDSNLNENVKTYEQAF